MDGEVSNFLSFSSATSDNIYIINFITQLSRTSRLLCHLDHIVNKCRICRQRLVSPNDLPWRLPLINFISLKGNRSWFINPKGSKRRLISPQWQSKFKQTQIACVEYDDITEEQQREIFQVCRFPFQTPQFWPCRSVFKWESLSRLQVQRSKPLLILTQPFCPFVNRSATICKRPHCGSHPRGSC